MGQNAKELFLELGIEGGEEAVIDAAAAFLRTHPLFRIVPSNHDLTDHELSLLAAGGFPAPATSLSDAITQVAGEVGVLIASALSQAQAAKRLGVDASRIRQRIAQRTLYAVQGNTSSKVLPLFQFTESGTLPHLEKIIPVISASAHPMAVQRFFLSPTPDLYSEETASPLSPRDWLLTGHSPDLVIRMAADV